MFWLCRFSPLQNVMGWMWIMTTMMNGLYVRTLAFFVLMMPVNEGGGEKSNEGESKYDVYMR